MNQLFLVVLILFYPIYIYSYFFDHGMGTAAFVILLE